jgi:hypothetical protein
MHWERYSANGYECSSQGDTRFSALFATLADGRTIEEAYQLDAKGYRKTTSNWRDAKGLPPLNAKSRQELWLEYLGFWRQFAQENPELITELRALAAGKVLTDRFANSAVNQARALSVIISEQEALELLPFTF